MFLTWRVIEGCIKGGKVHGAEDVDKGFSVLPNEILHHMPLVHRELEVLLHAECIIVTSLQVSSKITTLRCGLYYLHA